MEIDFLGCERKDDSAVFSRRERKKRDQKYAIIRAAQDIIEAKGYVAASVNEIAEAADIAYGTFFNYFPTKEDMLLFIEQVEYEDLHEIISIRFADVDTVSAVLEGVFLEWCNDSFRYRNTSIQLDAAIIRVYPPNYVGKIHRLLVSVLQEGVRRGEFRADLDCELAAYMLEAIRYVAVRSGQASLVKALFQQQLQSMQA